MDASSTRYAAAPLEACARTRVLRSGVRADIAGDVASILVDGDLLGHTTHGLALLAPYLGEIERGTMARDGSVSVVNQRAATETWDGHRLPGPWCTLRALDRAIELAATQGTGTVVIRRSHHIACLAAYAKRAADRGIVELLYCYERSVCRVAPFGGVQSVFTPHTLAGGRLT